MLIEVVPYRSEWIKMTSHHEYTSMFRMAGRRNQRYGILFRDYLRANDRARDAYGAFKQNLARFVGHLSHPGGTGPYLDMKDPVLDLISESAERWAEMTTWGPGPSDA